MLPISLFTYAFALWLGLYLLARDARQPLLRFTGLGLVSYAFALCGGILQAEASTPDQGVAARLLLPFIFLPALFWAAFMSAVEEAEVIRTLSYQRRRWQRRGGRRKRGRRR